MIILKRLILCAIILGITTEIGASNGTWWSSVGNVLSGWRNKGIALACENPKTTKLAAGLLATGTLFGVYYAMYGNPFKKKTNLDHSLQSKIQWALATRQGDRLEMEDTHHAVSDDNHAFFGIYDGHAGSLAAEAAVNRDKPGFNMEKIDGLYHFIIENVRQDKDLETSIKEGFINFDKAFGKKYFLRDNSGTTALTTLITNNGQEDMVTIGWAGDSRAVVVNDQGSVIYSTRDHKPNDPDETDRIAATGKKITSKPDGNGGIIYRINGLSVARALGDSIDKVKDGTYSTNVAITALPEVHTMSIQKERIKYIILACDGVWDVLSNDDATHIINEDKPTYLTMFRPAEREETELTDGNNSSLKQSARILRDEAYNRCSHDNISALIIKFDN